MLTYLSYALVVQWLQVITTAICASPQWPFELGGELRVNVTTFLALVSNLLLGSLLVQQQYAGTSKATAAFLSCLIVLIAFYRQRQLKL